VFGFIAGRNSGSDKQAQFADSEAIAAFIDNYCAQNPLEYIVSPLWRSSKQGAVPPLLRRHRDRQHYGEQLPRRQARSDDSQWLNLF
jgi:hypothetical protein